MGVQVAGVTVSLGFDSSNVNGVVLGQAPDLEYRICKATEGTGFTDGLFVQNRHAARAAGQLFGAYHFGHRGDAVAQADHFINTVNASGGFTGIMAWLDVELQNSTDGPSFGDVLAFGKRFAQRVPGKPLGIYTGGWYWRGHLGNPAGLSRVPLWDSNYVVGSGTPEQIVQRVTPRYFASYGGWSGRLIRQYSSNATIDGHHPFDVNEHEGSVEDLRRAFGIVTGVPAPRPVAVVHPVMRHPFHALGLSGHLDRATIDATQWWVNVHRDGISGRDTAKALQTKIGARVDGVWGRGTTQALQRYLERYARRWWNPHLTATGNLDKLTVTTLQRYLNRLAGF